MLTPKKAYEILEQYGFTKDRVDPNMGNTVGEDDICASYANDNAFYTITYDEYEYNGFILSITAGDDGYYFANTMEEDVSLRQIIDIFEEIDSYLDDMILNNNSWKRFANKFNLAVAIDGMA